MLPGKFAQSVGHPGEAAREFDWRLKLKKLAPIVLSALALALPASAGAALPKPSSTLIVPNKSIAGVALGAKISQVKKAWGKGGKCEYDCVYEAARKNETEGPSLARVLCEEKRQGAPRTAWMISISVGYKTVGTETVPTFKTPLTAFKTAKGIGLGSKASELARAYPKAEKQGTAGAYWYEIPGPKEAATIFVFSNGNRVTTITVELHPGG